MPWQALGTLNPNLEWQILPTSVENSHLIKVSFASTGDINRVLSHAWLRRVWAGTSPTQVDPAFRVYPKPEQVLYNVPISQLLIDQGQVNAQWEVKLGRWRRNYSEPAWSISIEAWV